MKSPILETIDQLAMTGKYAEANAMASPPAVVICCATERAPSTRLSAIATAPPSADTRSATAAPMPEPPPRVPRHTDPLPATAPI